MSKVGHRAHAHADPQSMGDWIGLYLSDYGMDGRRAVATNVTFEQAIDGQYTPPTLRIPRENAQSLMDDLWHCGLRPTLGKQSEGVTAAQGRHLEDMRAVAFAKLNIEKPI